MADRLDFTASNFTCRWITRPTIAGSTIRIHLSNVYSPVAETFGALANTPLAACVTARVARWKFAHGIEGRYPAVFRFARP